MVLLARDDRAPSGLVPNKPRRGRMAKGGLLSHQAGLLAAGKPP